MPDKGISVVIADDEPAARRFVRRHLDAFAPQIAIRGEASNAGELFSILSAKMPDILVLDIMMPGLSGLEVLKRIGSGRRNAKVLVISAYDRFEFAREALSLGVAEFLLKPVRTADLMEAVSKCIKSVLEDREREDSYRSYQKQAQSAGGIVKGLLVRDLVDKVVPESSESGLWNNLEALNLGSLQSLIAADVPVPDEAAGDEEHFSIHLRKATALWADAHESIWCMRGQSRVVLFPQGDDASSSSGLARLSRNLRRHLTSLLPKGAPLVRVAYTGPNTDGLSVERQHEAVCKALNRAYVQGRSIVRAATAESLGGSSLNSVFLLECQLAKEVVSGTPHAALARLEELVAHVASSSSQRSDALAAELAAVVSQACMIAAEKLADPHEIIELRNSYMHHLMNVETADELVRFARDCLSGVFRTRESKKSESQRLVLQAISILEKRASEDVRLSEVASGVFVSPSYLSRLFKAICGVNFHEYLTRIRVEKAKALLRDTGFPCGEVGRAVGYPSASHFSQVFRQATGQSPTEFRANSNIATPLSKD